jgi:stage II sporulation protein D
MKPSTCALVLVIIAAGAACSTPVSRAGLPSATLPSASVRVGVMERGRLSIRTVPLERYVETAILSEFAPADGNVDTVEGMLEVQAVIGRTYAVAHLGRHARDGYDVCDRTHCQLFQPGRLTTSRWAPQAADAVRRTASQVLWFDGAPALTVFHADCGGRTSAAADVWGGTVRPYLVGRADDGPADDVHSTWHFEASQAAVQAALNTDTRTRVGSSLEAIQVVDRDAAGRAETIAIRGSVERMVRGDVVREVLAGAFGARTVRSTWLDVRREQGRFVFDGRGFGHGVGLCQAGALARIRAGARVSGVLQRYFPGTKLVTLG